MARKAPLRAVTPGEQAPPKEPGTVLEATESGNRLDELKAMRRRVAKALDDQRTAPRDLASLSRRLIEIGREIDALLVAEDEDRSVVVNTDDEAWDESAI